jgi:hypothetical protein
MALPNWFVTAQNNAAAAVIPPSAAPAGTLNGINTVFRLSSTANLLMLTLNGVGQEPGVDFALSGVTVTFTVPPVASDWMMAFYN